MQDTDRHAEHASTTEPLLQSLTMVLRQALDGVDEAQWRISDASRPLGDDDVRAVRHLLESVKGNLMDTIIGLQLVQRARDLHPKDYPPPSDKPRGPGTVRDAGPTNRNGPA